MNMNIVKVCKKHGDLTESQISIENRDRVNKKPYARCLQCKSEKQHRFYEKNVDYRIQKANEWRKNNRELINQRAREDRKNNPEKYSRWKKNYTDSKRDIVQKREACRQKGITVEQYDSMFESQGGVCMICKLPEVRKSRTEGQVTRLAIDHCHKTGKVRDLLCGGCNTALGKIKESKEILLSMIAYIEKWEGAT